MTAVAEMEKKAIKEQLQFTVNDRIKVKQAELINFTTELAVMLEAGVVLSDALEAIAEQHRPGAFRSVVRDLAGRISSGMSFSAALAGYPRVFNPMFVSMVKASEASGRMSEMLEVLSGYLSREAETRKQIKGAMIYPFIMILMATAATGTLMFFVLPRFTKIYESRGASLPSLTRALVSFSQFIGNLEAMTMVFTGLVTGGMLYYWWSKTRLGRQMIDWVRVHTPVIGAMFVDAAMTRSMRIMSTTLNTGVNLLEAISVIRSSSSNYYIQRLWLEVDTKIRDGYQLSDSITCSKDKWLVSVGIIQMLRAGEKSGKLGYVCDKASVFYEKKLESSIKTTTALIEPMMILIMGIIIGTIAVALLLPVFRISTVLSQ